MKIWYLMLRNLKIYDWQDHWVVEWVSDQKPTVILENYQCVELVPLKKVNELLSVRGVNKELRLNKVTGDVELKARGE